MVLFFAVAFSVLFFSYKNKPTEEEKRKKSLKTQELIISKIRQYKQNNTNLITDLPITTR
jgi:hypothetical protein